eukprot:2753956-Rhodomonas_salina.6
MSAAARASQSARAHGKNAASAGKTVSMVPWRMRRSQLVGTSVGEIASECACRLHPAEPRSEPEDQPDAP